MPRPTTQWHKDTSGTTTNVCDVNGGEVYGTTDWKTAEVVEMEKCGSGKVRGTSVMLMARCKQVSAVYWWNTL